MSHLNTTLIADVQTVLNKELPKPDGYSIKSTNESHADDLAKLWFDSYPREIAVDYKTAEEEMTAMFKGDYGKIWPDASPLIFEEDKLIAGICTVYKAPWDATPTCPFIVDLMVDPNFRKHNLATFLIGETCRAIKNNGINHVALRVLIDNVPAINLYHKLGFTKWDGLLYAPE